MNILDTDLASLVSWFLSSFGVGIISGYILNVFRRAAGYVR